MTVEMDPTEPTESALDGRVCIVTGAGSGIGRATAQAMSKAGAAVMLVGRRPELLRETAKSLASREMTFEYPGDVANASVVSEIVTSAIGRFGRVDILVNSAGVNVPVRQIEAISTEDWNAVVSINLNGAFYMVRALLPSMRGQQSGLVVNVSSMAAGRANLISGPAYSASKAGMSSLTESINLAERKFGVRACAVCPGEVDTPIINMRPVLPSDAARAAMLRPEDIARTILFVASLPERVTVELVHVVPTSVRDWTAEEGGPA